MFKSELALRLSFFTFLILSPLFLPSCSTNPATGEQQFAALMPPSQEAQIGAQEHQKIIRQYGVYPDAKLEAYVREVGARVTQQTERPDVQYKFYLLDTPMVNAFALPGGYIYTTRGLLALANSEAELAAVLAHETGHITARHSAERYSHGVVTGLGAAILSAALDSQGASQALGLGSDLYIKSYSRGQENQADSLGMRYLNRGGYDVRAMTGFLTSLQSNTALDARIEGRQVSSGVSYFATHPATAERVANTVSESGRYPAGGTVGRERYLQMIDGMSYGDSAAQGFIRGRSFFHPDMDFTFTVPDGFRLINQPSEVVATGPDGAVVIFDFADAANAGDPLTFLTQVWMKGEAVNTPERITVNGRDAATAAFSGQVNGRPSTIRLVAVQWAPGRFARFQMAIPSGAPAALTEGMKRTTYSLRAMTAQEKAVLHPYKIRIVTAATGETAASLARRMPFDTLAEDRFRVLNGLKPGEAVQAGRPYKVVGD